MFGPETLFENFCQVYQKIVKCLNLYRSRCLSLYGKACIVNLMALSKLWYLASVLLVPEKIIDMIEKEIFMFVWDGKMELLSRNTCYFPKLNGGLALVNIRIKIASLQMSQISKIVYCENLPWTYFGHMWLGISLRRFPDYKFTNVFPHCIEDLPIFYDNMRQNLNFLKELDKEIVPVNNAHCKFFYVQLIDAFVKRHGLHITEKFNHIDFSKAFVNIINKNIDPLAINVTFKMCHNVLPVAYRLHRFGIRIDKMCTFCKRDIETVEHLFYFCSFIQDIKKTLSKFFSKIGGIGFSLDAVRFSIFDKKVTKYHLNTFLIILSEYRHAIWTMCNKIRFEKNNLTKENVLNFFRNKIQCRIQIDFQRLDCYEFHMLWDHSCICSIDQGKIEYHF